MLTTQWSKLTSLVMVESERLVEGQPRYYISSLPNRAEVLLGAVRGHWGELSPLGADFGEDNSRVRNNASENRPSSPLRLTQAGNHFKK